MNTLAGSLLKEARKARAMSQKDLAQMVSISPTYVNLIENGRRIMTPQLLQQFSEALAIDETRLKGEANHDVLRKLQSSASFGALEDEELERLVVEMPTLAERVLQLEHKLNQSQNAFEKLSDRMSNDASLTTKIHELLSIATSIRSTSSILNTQGDLPAAQGAQFREALHQDARQLSETLRRLVDYLDQTTQADGTELQADIRLAQFLEDRQYYLEPLERNEVNQDNIEHWLGEAIGADLAHYGKTRRLFALLLRDIEALPEVHFLDATQAVGWRVDALAMHLDAPIDRVLRRMAMLSHFGDFQNLAMFIQDQTGQFLLSNISLVGFNVAELTCPFWPIFDCERARGELFEREILLPHEPPFQAMAASNLHQFARAPDPVWVPRTMLVCRGGEYEPLKNKENPRLVGLNCKDCRIKDCTARQNQPIISTKQDE